jgi:hypothetical protein
VFVVVRDGVDLEIERRYRLQGPFRAMPRHDDDAEDDADEGVEEDRR